MRMYHKFLLAGVSVLTLAAQAQAQEPAPAAATTAAENFGDDDIVVTARRRDERIQDVPLAITAISGEDLERNQINQLIDLNSKVPSLAIQPGQGSGRSQPSFSIRGLTRIEPSIFSDNSVSIYFNDVVVQRTLGINMFMYDLASVQVVKGPQGTLFGRNIMGGAILFQPERPGPDLGGHISIGYSRFDTREAEVMFNAPLASWANLRVAAHSLDSSGFVKDEVLNKNIDTTNELAVRAALEVAPISELKSLTYFNIARARNGGTGTFFIGFNPAAPFSTPAFAAANRWPGTYAELLAQQQARPYGSTASGLDQFNNVDVWSIDNSTTYNINDNLSIKSIIAYRDIDAHSQEDYDGVPVPALAIEYLHTQRQFTSELQVQYSRESLSAIGGLYYFRERGQSIGNVYATFVDPGRLELGPRPDGGNVSSTIPISTNKSYAIFGEANIGLDRLLEGVTLTLGGRYTWDSRRTDIFSRFEAGGLTTACRLRDDLDNNPATPPTVLPIALCEASVTKKYNQPTYNINLQYKFMPQGMLYLAHRHGYKSGAVSHNVNLTLFRIGTKPEFVDDFEFGIKADWRFGNALLRTNAAAFVSKYNDIQRGVSVPLSIPLESLVTNAAKGEVKGFEFEGLFRPVREVEFTGNFSYLKARYIEYIDLLGRDLSGLDFALVPKYIYNIGVNIYPPVAQGQLSIGANYSYQSKSIEVEVFNPLQTLPSFGLLDAYANWSDFANPGLEVGLFIKNALDKKYQRIASTSSYNTGLGAASRSYGLPRTYGVTVKYKFGGR